MKSNISSRKKSAIFIDIDETLTHVRSDTHRFKRLDLQNDKENFDLLERCYIMSFKGENQKQEHMWGIKRPYLDEFIRYCRKRFDIVALYTAGMKDYGEQSAKILFPNVGDLDYIYTREHCVDIERSIPSWEEDDSGKLVCSTTVVMDHVKPLGKLLKEMPELADVDPQKVLMVDNKESNFDYNVHLGLTISDYVPEATIESIRYDDRALLHMIDTIEKRIEKFDVSRVHVKVSDKRPSNWFIGMIPDLSFIYDLVPF